MAARGTIYVSLYHEKYKVVKLFFYLTMGFSPALVVTSMSNPEELHKLACRALIYFLGVVFKNNGIIPFVHATWHLFMATAAAVSALLCNLEISLPKSYRLYVTLMTNLY